MRKRSKALTTLAAFGLIGGAIAGTAGASAPPDTGGGGGAAAGAGVGRGSDSGIEGADFSGTTVTVFGPENSATEAGAMTAALDEFGDAERHRHHLRRRGATSSSRSTPRCSAATRPTSASSRSPASSPQFAQDGDAAAAARRRPRRRQRELGRQLHGVLQRRRHPVRRPVQVRPQVARVVRPDGVRPRRATRCPTTLDEFNALIDQMIANGDTPLCVGIESGPATGWPFTDWVEELVLRQQGIDYYNQWVAHEVPFNDPPIVDAFNEVAGPTAVDQDGRRVRRRAARSPPRAFGDNGQPLVEGNCMMHRQASFFAAFFPEGTTFGDGRRPGQSTFYFPSADEGQPVLVGGTNAGGVPRRPRGVGGDAVPRLAGVRQRPPGGADALAGGGLLRVPVGQPERRPRACGTPLEQELPRGAARPPTRPASTPPTRCPPRSDRARSGREATSFVNGDEDAQTAADNIEASWPTS